MFVAEEVEPSGPRGGRRWIVKCDQCGAIFKKKKSACTDPSEKNHFCTRECQRMAKAPGGVQHAGSVRVPIDAVILATRRRDVEQRPGFAIRDLTLLRVTDVVYKRHTKQYKRAVAGDRMVAFLELIRASCMKAIKEA